MVRYGALLITKGPAVAILAAQVDGVPELVLGDFADGPVAYFGDATAGFPKRAHERLVSVDSGGDEALVVVGREQFVPVEFAFVAGLNRALEPSPSALEPHGTERGITIQEARYPRQIACKVLREVKCNVTGMADEISVGRHHELNLDT